MADEIKIGDRVMWVHESTYVDYSFHAMGTVIDIFQTHVGGQSNHMTLVASVVPDPHEYWTAINRKQTTISVSKLRKVGE